MRAGNFLLDDLSKALGDANGLGNKIPEPKLGTFAKAMVKIFRGKHREECVQNTSLYKVFLCEDAPQKTGGYKSHDRDNGAKLNNTVSTKRWVLNYWCFSTGLAIEEIKRLGVRSIILTSGAVYI